MLQAWEYSFLYLVLDSAPILGKLLLIYTVKYALSSSSSSALASEEVEDSLCCTGRTLLSTHEAL